MIPTTPLSSPFQPKLLSRRSADGHIGYLLLTASSTPKHIGLIESEEYRLVQSLFNPSNTQTRFRPVEQTYDRVYSKATGNEYVSMNQRTHDVIRAKVLEVLGRVGTTEAGSYLHFTHSTRHMSMGIMPEPTA
jgi:hypothetical protein